MKKVFIGYGVLLVVVIILAFAKFQGLPFFPSTPTAEASAQINSQECDLDIEDTDEERMKGLSDRDNLNEDAGMLFVFEKKDRYSFWMKNVKFPLDIIFIDDNKIVDMYKNVPAQADKDTASLPLYTSKAPANYVLEIKGGLADEYEFKIGDTVEINR